MEDNERRRQPRSIIQSADADMPTAPDGYSQNCDKVARVQVGKAGLRLADQVKRLTP
jgi:hypothetical protein